MSKDCANCCMGVLVTETITGYPIPPEKQYYQCIGDGCEGDDCDEYLTVDEMREDILDDCEDDLEDLDEYCDVEENEWILFLHEKDICHPDAVGNMPCDNGAICDNCKKPWVEDAYTKWLCRRNM